MEVGPGNDKISFLKTFFQSSDICEIRAAKKGDDWTFATLACEQAKFISWEMKVTMLEGLSGSRRKWHSSGSKKSRACVWMDSLDTLGHFMLLLTYHGQIEAQTTFFSILENVIMKVLS